MQDYHNVTCVSPRNCFKEAFSKELIAHDEFWADVILTRNYTAHTYKEKLAEKIYQSLPEALNKFQKLFESIKISIKE